MFLERYCDSSLLDLQQSLNRAELSYGSAGGYDSLLTPTSTVLARTTADAITADLAALWEIYRIWTGLYHAARAGHQPDWIVDLVEHGLSPAELRAHRQVAAAGLEPRLCRVDYVCLGERRAVAEAQWKSGGPGLFVGIQRVNAAVVPYSDGTASLGDLTDGFERAILADRERADAVAVNDVRTFWRNGERYLHNALRARGTTYLAVERQDIGAALAVRGGRLATRVDGCWRPVTFLNGQEFTAAIDPDLLDLLAADSVAGRVWVETPLNAIYRQKWGLALPFLPGFADLFTDRQREALIPAALLRAEKIDLSPLQPYVSPLVAGAMGGVTDILGIAELPTSMRKMLVLKCGAGTGGYYNRGRGVFRLSGSRSADTKILQLVYDQVVNLGEPWIVQLYVRDTVAVPLSLPVEPLATRTVDCHARYLVFGRMAGHQDYRVIGGLGNYSRDWKVSGKSAGVDAHGHLRGSAFNELRVGTGAG